MTTSNDPAAAGSSVPASAISIQAGDTLHIGIEVTGLDDAAAGRLAWALAHDVQLPIRFTPDDSDVEGHGLFAPTEVTLRAVVDGVHPLQTVRLRFASRDEAADFRRRVDATGSLNASLARTRFPSHRA